MVTGLDLTRRRGLPGTHATVVVAEVLGKLGLESRRF